MIENLVHAYTPLLTWIGAGFLMSRFIPESLLKLLGKALYWVGVPLQLFVLARHTNLADGLLIPGVAVAVILLSIFLAASLWWAWHWFMERKDQSKPDNLDLPLETSILMFQPSKQSSLGSFILAAILGNTGFVGLTLTQVLTSPENNNWAILFSVTNNVVGTYSIAVLIASYFGDRKTQNHWWTQLKDLFTVPSLWTFFIGLNTQFVQLPAEVELVLEQAVWVVIALALLLVGFRLGGMKSWQSLQTASLASILKVFIIPALVGLGATYFGVTGEERLVLVLMSGTPTGLSVLILAEVYELDRNLLASSIAITFVGLLLALPLWLTWFA